jgi:hypothetical protein
MNVEAGLKALLKGVRMPMDGMVFKYFRRGEFIRYPSFNGILKEDTLVYEVSGGNGELFYMGADDMPFKSLVRKIENISEEDAVVIIASVVLMDGVKDRKKKLQINYSKGGTK